MEVAYAYHKDEEMELRETVPDGIDTSRWEFRLYRANGKLEITMVVTIDIFYR